MIEAARGVLRSHPRWVGTGTWAVALAHVAVHDPHRPGRLLRCPWRAVTGLDCPGCGGLRLVHDLLHGDLRSALHDNPFLLVAGPSLGALLLRAGAGGPGAEPIPARAAYALGATALLWAVVRNLPGWPLRPLVRA